MPGSRISTGFTPLESYWWLYVRNDIRHPGVANYFSLLQPPVSPSRHRSLATLVQPLGEGVVRHLWGFGGGDLA